MRPDHDPLAWQWVAGLCIALGACIVLGLVFGGAEFIGRACHYWRVRRTLRRLGEQWRREGVTGVAAFTITLGSDSDENGSRRLPDQGGADRHVRRAESDGEDAPGAGAREP